MGAATSTHEPLDRVAHEKVEKRSGLRGGGGGGDRVPRRMDRLRRSLRDSFRRRKEHVPESSKPHQWQADEAAVRAGTCNFHVKYLGCVEVFESRGMQVCEEALKVLRNSRRRPVKAILYVSGDGLRVVEDETKGLIVDQTIEKVSFCAPDRNHEKGFSYICRDGTTRRWMCHGFLALKESGERLSHAVGCAFAACLERKQKRDKECGVTMTFDPKNSTFTRTGSFRQTSITERLQDPQDFKPTGDAVPPAKTAVHNPFAIERPHATPTMLQRQGSFRGFQQLNQASPFKRQLSLRISDLPSTLERQRSLSLEGNDLRTPIKAPVSPIPEASPVSDKADPVTVMCQQLTQGLSLLSSDDPFLSQPNGQVAPTILNNQSAMAVMATPPSTGVMFANSVNHNTTGALVGMDQTRYGAPWPLPPRSDLNSNGVIPTAITSSTWSSTTITSQLTTANSTAVVPFTPPRTQPITQQPPTATTSNSIASQPVIPPVPAVPPVPSVQQVQPTPIAVDAADLPRPEQWLGSITGAVVAGDVPLENGSSITAEANNVQTQPPVVQPFQQQSTPRRAPHLAHLRAHSLGSAETFLNASANVGQNSWWSGSGDENYTPGPPSHDPFDAEWAAIAARNHRAGGIGQGGPMSATNSGIGTNPFAQNVVKAFEVQM